MSIFYCLHYVIALLPLNIHKPERTIRSTVPLQYEFSEAKKRGGVRRGDNRGHANVETFYLTSK